MDAGTEATGKRTSVGPAKATEEPAMMVLASDSDGLDGGRWGSRTR